MTYFSDISSALDSKLNEFSIANDVAVAWENKDFEPKTNVLYLRATQIPSNTDQIGMSANGLDEHKGVYQVDILAPSGEGKGSAYMVSDQVADLFKRGSILVYNNTRVRIRTVTKEKGFRDEGRFIVPVVIYYQSLTQSRG